jgi:hypothetical protein
MTGASALSYVGGMTNRIALPLTILALLIAGCGGGSDSPRATGPDAAVKEALLKWTFEGDCDSMTDKFLEQQAFIGDTRQERCDYLEKTFQKPQYSEDDLKFRSVKVAGTKATVVVGSDIASITTTYTLLQQGGKWRIDEAD